jgi:hypothetical protein
MIIYLDKDYLIIGEQDSLFHLEIIKKVNYNLKIKSLIKIII